MEQDKCRWILYTALVIGLVALLVYILRPAPQPDPHQKTIDSLNVQIETKNRVIKSYDSAIAHLADSLGTLDKKLAENNTRTKTISKYYEVKTNAVNSFTVDSMDNYFRTRYDSLYTKQGHR